MVEDDLAQEQRRERTGHEPAHAEHGSAGQSHAPSGQVRQGNLRFAHGGFFGTEDKNAGIAGILNALHLEELDSGDILLLLIILFLFLEGDNIEMVITLGLMLLLGLGDEQKKHQ